MIVTSTIMKTGSVKQNYFCLNFTTFNLKAGLLVVLLHMWKSEAETSCNYSPLCSEMCNQCRKVKSSSFLYRVLKERRDQLVRGVFLAWAVHLDPPGTQDLWLVPLTLCLQASVYSKVEIVKHHCCANVDYITFIFSCFDFVPQGEPGSDGAAGKDVSNVQMRCLSPIKVKWRVTCRFFIHPLIDFFVLFLLTGCSRTPGRPRSSGSKSKSSLGVMYHPLDSVCCPAEHQSSHYFSWLLQMHPFSAPSGRPSPCTLTLFPFLPSQHLHLTQSSVHQLSDPPFLLTSSHPLLAFFFFFLPGP